MLPPLNFKRIGQPQHNRPVVVLLHGFMGSLSDWQSVIAPFICEQEFLLIDLPGHGQSAAPSNNRQCGFEQFHQQLSQQLKQEGITKYRLYGYSLGGRLALYHAAQNPAGLQSLMLESCHPGLTSQRQRIKRQAWQKRWSGKFLQLPTQQLLEQWYSQSVFVSLNPVQKQQQIAAKRAEASKRTWQQTLSLWSLHQQPNLHRCMSKPLVPTRFLVGTRDSKYAKLAGRMIRAKWPVQIDLCRNAGHNVHATTPLQWQHYFSHWLSGTDHD